MVSNSTVWLFLHACIIHSGTNVSLKNYMLPT